MILRTFFLYARLPFPPPFGILLNSGKQSRDQCVCLHIPRISFRFLDGQLSCIFYLTSLFISLKFHYVPKKIDTINIIRIFIHLHSLSYSKKTSGWDYETDFFYGPWKNSTGTQMYRLSPKACTLPIPGKGKCIPATRLLPTTFLNRAFRVAMACC
jgi:hypothetical protein